MRYIKQHGGWGPELKALRGFTLAETLITLGIIGIVATLTMPSLIANYQKKVLETRIKKFYSVMQQAANMKKAEDGDLDGSMFTTKFSPAEMMLFFDVNYNPYLKTISVDKMTKGIIVGFPDGSGAYWQKSAAGAGTGDAFVIFCVNYKHCKNMDTSSPAYQTDGKNTFVFYLTGHPANYPVSDRSAYLALCKSNHHVCARVLMLDGWEIKDDYPW